VSYPIRFATWNSQALISALSVNQLRANRKIGLLGKLMDKVDVIAIQETHGDAGDSAALGRIFPNWRFLESTSTGSVGGGTLFAIRRVFASQFTLIEHSTLVPGRVHAVVLGAASGQQLIFVNLHISPSLGHSDTKALFVRISNFICRYSPLAAVFIMGDFNFLEVDDARYHASTGKFTRDSNTLPLMFQNTFPEFTELAQPDFTRAGAARDIGLEVFSRIDRVYCNIPPSQLLDCVLAAGVWATATSIFKISDHRPVVVTIRPKNLWGNRPTVIPKWIACHARFAGEANAVLIDNPLGTHPGENLAHLKEVLHMAAINVKRFVRDKPAETLDEKLHWAISFVRAIRVGDLPRMQLAVVRCSELAEALDTPDNIRSANPLRAHRLVEGLSRQVAERELEGAQATRADRSKVDTLQMQAAAWRKAGRRLSLNAVRNEAGDIITDPAEAARFLQGHWQGVFDHRPIDEDLADQAIALTTPFDPMHCWTIKPESFLHIVSAAKASAPGPDGIPYSAYKAIRETAAPIFHEAFHFYLGGEPLPTGFNDSHLVFIPKGEEALNDIDGSTARSPANTRPISLGNTDNKIFAGAINHVLAGATAKVIGQYQQGFIRGRSIVHQVIALDGYASLWAKFHHKDLAVILFDIIAAFPSLSHSFIFKSLVFRGLPPPLIEFIRKLYRDVAASFSVGGSAPMLIRVLAGIKQGCPLSATIFALAFDGCIALVRHSSIAGSIKYLAYADDFATIVKDLWVNFLPLMATILLFDRVANLRISWKKTVVIPLYPVPIQILRARLVAMFPLIAPASFALCGKYLGVFFGPGADTQEWQETACKIRKNARTLKSLAFGISTSMLWYNLAVASVASHVGQLVAPNTAMLRAEAAALAVTTAGPCGAIPVVVLGALKRLGFPQQFASVARSSVAARYRVSLSTPIFHELVLLHAEAARNVDSLFRPPMLGWIESSLFANLASHHLIMSAVPSLRGASSEPRIQSFVMSKLLVAPAILAKAVASILERAKYWQRKLHIPNKYGFFEHLLANLRLIFRCLPPFAAFNSLRSVMNAWPTSARVAQSPAPCLFGCGGSDSLLHYCMCPPVLAVCADLVPLSSKFLSDPLFLLCLYPFNEHISHEKPLIFAAGILADAAFVARSVASHSGRPPPLRSIFLGRFKQIARSSEQTRARLMRVCCLIEDID
jgi:hypothetical protein